MTAGVELDPWGGDTTRSWGQHQQPQRFTSYQRDGNESDEAMMRRYNRWWSRFDQPDPADFSYDLSDPQSFNRYSYTQNDPVNFVDPTGLDMFPSITVTCSQMIDDDGRPIRAHVHGRVPLAEPAGEWRAATARRRAARRRGAGSRAAC